MLISLDAVRPEYELVQASKMAASLLQALSFWRISQVSRPGAVEVSVLRMGVVMELPI